MSAERPENPEKTPNAIRSIRLGLLAAVGSWFLTYYTSRDWCCASAGAAILGGFATIIFDILMGTRNSVSKWAKVAQLTLVFIVVGVLSIFFWVPDTELFRQAFGVMPDDDIRDLVVDSAMHSPSGDGIVLMRFFADQETIDALVSHRKFIDNRQSESWWWEDWEVTRNWEALWDHAFSSFPDSGGKNWHDVAPMEQPHLYDWTNYEQKLSPNSSLLEQTRLLWDAESGRAYVMCILG